MPRFWKPRCTYPPSFQVVELTSMICSQTIRRKFSSQRQTRDETRAQRQENCLTFSYTRSTDTASTLLTRPPPTVQNQHSQIWSLHTLEMRSLRECHSRESWSFIRRWRNFRKGRVWTRMSNLLSD